MTDIKLQHAHLNLWRLISPALPVGAYAYSQGLEYAVDTGWVFDEDSASDWIIGLASHSLAALDVPVLKRLYRAWKDKDQPCVQYWCRFLLASRESSELVAEDRQLGMALATLLTDLDVADASCWKNSKDVNFACMFALAAFHWKISVEETAQGYLWAWCENQITAAIKLVPLGQTAGQRILSRVVTVIPDAVEVALNLEDDEIGLLAHGLGIASARHETQYSRLFRS